MRNRWSVRRLRTLIGAAACASMAAATLAAAQQPTSQQPSKEQRDQMAKVHERMAACLRSSKSMEECRGEMQKNCRQMMGEEGCPMMGSGMGGPGMGRDQMRQNRPEQEQQGQPDD